MLHIYWSTVLACSHSRGLTIKKIPYIDAKYGFGYRLPLARLHQRICWQMFNMDAPVTQQKGRNTALQETVAAVFRKPTTHKNSQFNKFRWSVITGQGSAQHFCGKLFIKLSFHLYAKLTFLLICTYSMNTCQQQNIKLGSVDIVAEMQQLAKKNPSTSFCNNGSMDKNEHVPRTATSCKGIIRGQCKAF